MGLLDARVHVVRRLAHDAGRGRRAPIAEPVFSVHELRVVVHLKLFGARLNSETTPTVQVPSGIPSKRNPPSRSVDPAMSVRGSSARTSTTVAPTTGSCREKETSPRSRPLPSPWPALSAAAGASGPAGALAPADADETVGTVPETEADGALAGAPPSPIARLSPLLAQTAAVTALTRSIRRGKGPDELREPVGDGSLKWRSNLIGTIIEGGSATAIPT